VQPVFHEKKLFRVKGVHPVDEEPQKQQKLRQQQQTLGGMINPHEFIKESKG
jgi:hypothetical protein